MGDDRIRDNYTINLTELAPAATLLSCWTINLTMMQLPVYTYEWRETMTLKAAYSNESLITPYYYVLYCKIRVLC